VQHNEIAYYQQALTNYQSLVADPCHFTLDPVVASASKITYDGTPSVSTPTRGPLPDRRFPRKAIS